VIVAFALWVALALVVEALAWRAVRLGRKPGPPIFRSPPRRGAAAPGASLAFLGDLQRGVADVVLPLARVLRERPADLLVSSGDFVAHAEAPYYGTLIDAFERAGIDTPARAVPGNHDLHARRVRDPAAGYALFASRFGPPSWAARVGPLLVVGLDDAVGPVAGEQLRWLERTVRAHLPLPWIAVCHRPPRRVDLPGAGAEPDLTELVAFLEAHPPRLVVCGHQHAYLEREVAGVLYVVNAHGGDVHGTRLSRGPFDLLRVDVDAAGVLAREVTRHRPRRWPRVYLNQLAVRCWWARRRGLGRWFTLPAAVLLSGMGMRAALNDPEPSGSAGAAPRPAPASRS
jgi:predicted phosphodiesterase